MEVGEGGGGVEVDHGMNGDWVIEVLGDWEIWGKAVSTADEQDGRRWRRLG
jgi:hypothetical protein